MITIPSRRTAAVKGQQFTQRFHSFCLRNQIERAFVDFYKAIDPTVIFIQSTTHRFMQINYLKWALNTPPALSRSRRE